MFAPGYFRNSVPPRDWHALRLYLPGLRCRNPFRWTPPYPRRFRHF